MKGKKLKKKLEKQTGPGQQALEYLMTYGWSLILIITVVGAITMLIIPRGCQTSHSISNNFLIENFQVTGSDSVLLPNRFVLILKPKMPTTIESYDIQFGGTECTENVIMESVRYEKFDRIVISGDIKEECQNAIDQCYQFTDTIGYTDYFGYMQEEEGRIMGTFSSVSQSYDSTDWERSEFASGILENEHGELIGSFGGVCPAAVPSGGVSFIPAAAYETWALPGGCNTSCANGGCTGGGFAVAQCNINAQFLSHGWYKAQLWMSPLFAERQLFLVGNAAFDPPGGGDRVTNGICINDNFYFYVNGELLRMGGTTGILNSEVIRDCDNCDESDGWCIPPVELTASSQFKFDEWNDIYVLVEDYCISGGLKAFQFYMA